MTAKNAVEEKQGGRRRKKKDEAIEEVDENELAVGLTEAKGRATPSRRIQTDSVKKEGNIITRPLHGIWDYLDGVRGELAKVTWPTRQQTLDLTRIVLVACIASALILGLISLLFTELFRLGLAIPEIMVVLVILAVVALLYYVRMGSRHTSTY